jgi:hypothetical protein
MVVRAEAAAVDARAVISFGAVRVEVCELSPTTAAWVATVVRSLQEAAT